MKVWEGSKMSKEWSEILRTSVHVLYYRLVDRGFILLLMITIPLAVFGTFFEVKETFMEEGIRGVLEGFIKFLIGLGALLCAGAIAFFFTAATVFKIRAFEDAGKGAECRNANLRDNYDFFRILFFNSDQARKRFYDV